MTFFSSIRSVFSKYATFSGRAGRPEFWWWTLFEYVTRGLLGAIYTVIMFDMIAPIIASGATDDAAFDQIMAAVFNPAYFVLLAWSLAILLPSLAVAVRRLHDTGRSGWFVLLTFLPLVGTILMIVFMVAPSDPKSNAWGALPKSK
jgi:uncharacterized membrane protein YhaH (DUF805 family)